METKIKMRDHFKGTNIFDLGTEEKISYAKVIPYKYATIASPFVDEACVDPLKTFASKFTDPGKQFAGLKTYTTVDGNELYGYEITLNNIPYVGFEPFDGLYGDEPAELKSLRERGVPIVVHSVYFTADGNIKYFGVKIQTKDLPTVSEFANRDDFEKIRSSVIGHRGIFPCKYWFDLTDSSKFSLSVIDGVPIQIASHDVYAGRDEVYYRKQKTALYAQLLSDEVITQDEHDFILTSSPRMQQTMLKFLWDGNTIVKRELDSVCVHEYEDI